MFRVEEIHDDGEKKVKKTSSLGSAIKFMFRELAAALPTDNFAPLPHVSPVCTALPFPMVLVLVFFEYLFLFHGNSPVISYFFSLSFFFFPSPLFISFTFSLFSRFYFHLPSRSSPRFFLFRLTETISIVLESFWARANTAPAHVPRPVRRKLNFVD